MQYIHTFLHTPPSLRYHLFFHDVTTVCGRIRCESLYGGIPSSSGAPGGSKPPKECLRVLQPGGE